MEGGICSRTVYALATSTWCLLLAQSACATSVGWRSRLLRDCLQKVFFFLCFFEADRFVVCCWPAVGLGGREPDPVCRLSPISPPFSVSCFLFIETLSRKRFLWSHFYFIRCGLYLKAKEMGKLLPWIILFSFFCWQSALCDGRLSCPIERIMLLQLKNSLCSGWA